MIDFLTSPLGIWTASLTVSGLAFLTAVVFHSSAVSLSRDLGSLIENDAAIRVSEDIRILFGVIVAAVVLIGLPIVLVILGDWVALVAVAIFYPFIILLFLDVLVD